MTLNSFNKTKAINSLIFIGNKIADSNGIADKYTALKMLYFAEVIHLTANGRFITDDDFATLPHGTTPSKSYDLLKAENKEPSFEILSNEKFKCVAPFDVDELSQSEVESLLKSYEENKFFGFFDLKTKAHDQAYNMTKDKGGRFVPIDFIATQQNLSESQIAYIKEHYEFLESLQWLNL